MAFTIILVNLKGTPSGNFFLDLQTSQQSPKSMCTILPLCLSIIKLLGCLSPKPNMYPAMLVTAADFVKFVLLPSQISEF